ncbi:hypothetical protein PV703_04735 [Streptomyces sp. ME01-24h]|nr:hypothetical protein [Streptomyces sp. ME19-03-3]MDX3352643.1 hypothetical protein [Streptomyces sp. ME01-24h]
MRRPTGGSGDPAAADGIARCEDFLSWHAEAGDARSAAHAFADRLPWLTTGQREEVLRQYVADRLDLAGLMLRRISRRDGDLREEYEQRYQALRHRLLCTVVTVALLSAAVCVPVPLLLLLTGD